MSRLTVPTIFQLFNNKQYQNCKMFGKVKYLFNGEHLICFGFEKEHQLQLYRLGLLIYDRSIENLF